MRPKTYRVELTEAERVQLLLLIRQGKTPARALQRAHILLRAAEGAFDHESADALHVSLRTVERVRQRFAEAPPEERLDRALYDRPRRGSDPKLDTPRRILPDRAGLQQAAPGARTLDDATAGRPARGTGHRRGHLG